MGNSFGIKGDQKHSFRKSSDAKTQNLIQSVKNRSPFQTVLVIDYISDPKSFLNEEITITPQEKSLNSVFNGKDSNQTPDKLTNYNRYTEERRVINPSALDYMPRNSIIGYTISEKNPEYFIFFPMFSSHISMPLKPGELAWVMYENSGDNIFGYWMCRKPGSIYVEDPSFAYHDRHTLVSMLGKNKSLEEKEYSDAIHFVNEKVRLEKGYIDSNLDMDSIHAKSSGYKDFKGSLVVPGSVKCADLFLQGSNNNRIHMTNSDMSNTGQIKISCGIKRDIPLEDSEKVFNIRTDDHEMFSYEEYQKFSDIISSTDDPASNFSKPDISVNPGSAALPGNNFLDIEASLPTFQSQEEKGIQRNTEPAVLIVKEIQQSFDSIKGSFYEMREGLQENKTEDSFCGNIYLKTIAENSVAGRKFDSFYLDMLGGSVRMENTVGSTLHIKDTGEIVIKAPSDASDSGPHVMIGGESIQDTEPMVLGDKLFSFLDSLLTTLANSTVVTPAGTSSPLSTLVPSLLTDLPTQLQKIRSKNGRIK